MDFKPVYLREEKGEKKEKKREEKQSVKPVKMEGKVMKAKRLLVLAVGAMLVMNVSAREVRKGGAFRCKSVRSEQKMVRCERCGKMIDLRKEAKFRKFGKKGEFRKGEFKKRHRHHGRI